MPVHPELRALDIDLPAPPDALLRLSLLMAEPEIDLLRVAEPIESDMALASAAMRAVNTSSYGLKGRVQSVQQAITYLGTSEVAALKFEYGLWAVFPPVPELEPIWQRAARRDILALWAVCRVLMHDPQTLEAVVPRVAVQAELDATLLLRATQRMLEQPAAATQREH